MNPALFDDLGHGILALATLAGLGLVMAFSPTTFGIEIGALDGPRAARRQVFVIAAAVAVEASLLGALFLVVSPNTLHALRTGRVATLLEQRWLDAGVGVILVVIGVVRWVRAARPPVPRRRTREFSSPWVLAAMVFVNSLASTSGPATMYLVVRTIGTLRPVVWPLAYVVFLAAVIVPYLLIGIAWGRLPGFAHRVSGLVAKLHTLDLRRPVAGLIALIGLALILWSGWSAR